ncbi:hypothetical protein [Larkinella rosea]|uniref:EpsG family protein n=1 Tax=Larkinella rosea TaxID=2025312 RepID=A0A3P1BPX9_9BACT|nr:hypothetical protein [Larkinella rosea]RRB02644.1 hypothetical protein EHT25_19550 [Larkinella rosea]
MKRIVFSVNTYLIALLIFVLILGFRTIWRPIHENELGYMLAETLMNYKFGFNRRAFLGNFFLPFHDPSTLLMLITVAYVICFVAPLLIARRFAGNNQTLLVAAYLIIFSPFGFSMFVKDPLAIRKELFFYPLFYLLVALQPRILWRNIVFIIVGCFIHESFFFLFLPFFLGFHWINETASRKQLLLYAATGFLVTFALTRLPGNSSVVTEQFIRHYVALGFERGQFEGFEYFQKLPFWQNIQNAQEHLTGFSPVVYLVLYSGQMVLIWLGLTRFGSVNRHKRLLFSQIGIAFMAIALFFLAMDYGRWLSMAFLTSVLLTASQVKIRVSFRPKPLSLLVALIILLGILVVRVPHFSQTGFTVNEWVMTHKLFVAGGLFLGGWLLALVRERSLTGD